MADAFMSPHDVPAIPGTEGWEKLYPYHYQFSKDDPARSAFEESQLWFYDGLHYPEPHYPFDLIWDEAWFLALVAEQHAHLPDAAGAGHRPPHRQRLRLHHPGGRRQSGGDRPPACPPS